MTILPQKYIYLIFFDYIPNGSQYRRKEYMQLNNKHSQRYIMKRNEVDSMIYPVTPQDRMNYLLSLSYSNQQISMVLYLPIKLDSLVLERAFQLTLKLIPILNCRFVEAETPYWESLEGNVEKTICSLENCEDADIEIKVNQYITEPGDCINGPLIQAKLFRAKKDRLCVKISHLCSDGAGLKEYMELLASIYTQISQSNNSDLIECQLLANHQPGFRDQSPLFVAAGIPDIKSALRQDENVSNLWALPPALSSNNKPKLEIQRLNHKQMKNLTRRTKEYGATVNDALIATFFRSLQDQTIFTEPHAKKKAITTTVNLRRYLPARTTGTICNLSGFEMPAIELQNGESFEATLKKVKTAMDTIKSHQPGLSSAARMELMAEMPLSLGRSMYRQQNATSAKRLVSPILTNLGIISNSGLRFGNIDVEDGYMAAPIMYNSFFCVGASTYNNMLTLSIGFNTADVSEEVVNRIMDIMIKELTV